MSETIKEVYEVLKEIINSKKARSIKENMNFFTCIKYCFVRRKGTRNKISIRTKKVDLKEINLKLCNKVNCLEKEINKISLSYQEKINNLEMIISNQAKEIDILNQWKEKYDIKIQNLIEKKKMIFP